MSELIKFAGCKIKAQKINAFPYTNNEPREIEIIT